MLMHIAIGSIGISSMFDTKFGNRFGLVVIRSLKSLISEVRICRIGISSTLLSSSSISSLIEHCLAG